MPLSDLHCFPNYVYKHFCIFLSKLQLWEIFISTHDPDASFEISERKRDNFLNTFSLRFKSFWKSAIHEYNMEQCHLSEDSILCLYKRIVYVIFISFLIQLESLLWLSKNNFVKNERVQIIISLFCPET